MLFEALYPAQDKQVYGSVYPMTYALEKSTLTWDRVKQLNQWLEGFPEGIVGRGSRWRLCIRLISQYKVAPYLYGLLLRVFLLNVYVVTSIFYAGGRVIVSLFDGMEIECDNE